MSPESTFAHTGSDPLTGELSSDSFRAFIKGFDRFGKESVETFTALGNGERVPVYVNEYWTARQRQGHSLHEVSYRACFKPQLPRFFIELLTRPGDTVYDPFMGRGTTLLEAALCGRRPVGNDINPLAQRLLRPRLQPPLLEVVEERLRGIPWQCAEEEPLDEDLLVFFHPETLRQILSLRRYLENQEEAGASDAVDDWIRMVATNRLTGHSPGFFSVYTLPPNQAVRPNRQRLINEKRKQTPPPRDVTSIILKKSRQLLGDLTPEERATLKEVSADAILLTGSADATKPLATDSVDLLVTSPPFLKVIDYETDNWMRSWFNGIDPKGVHLWQAGKLHKWEELMARAFAEFFRILKPGAWIAFEVGEVSKGKVNLDEAVLPVAKAAGLTPVCTLINQQDFTKTANCWGVDNQSKGTNTNRIVVARKPGASPGKTLPAPRILRQTAKPPTTRTPTQINLNFD
ncbi:MAG: hypothetical protein JJT96_02680 [Opitutales bacterium]|nr:hypothetical protein [Opitutales bacterium]